MDTTCSDDILIIVWTWSCHFPSVFATLRTPKRVSWDTDPGTSYVRGLAPRCEMGSDCQCEIWCEIACEIRRPQNLASNIEPCTFPGFCWSCSHWQSAPVSHQISHWRLPPGSHPGARSRTYEVLGFLGRTLEPQELSRERR